MKTFKTVASFDAEHVKLSGDSISGVSTAITDVEMDTTTVNTVLDHEKLNTAALEVQLEMAINNKMDAGMRFGLDSSYD